MLPTCAAVGVQLKVVCAGLPLAGNAGVKAEAGTKVGIPDAEILTEEPGSESSALTEKVRGCPTVTVNVEPSAGVTL